MLQPRKPWPLYTGIFLLLWLGLYSPLWAQETTGLAAALEEFNVQHDRFDHTGMLVLGSWAVANMVVGGIGMARTQGQVRSFHQMNFFWNVVNLSLAASGYFAYLKSDPAGYTLYETMARHNTIKTILLLNTGLDVAYMVTGGWLRERSKHVTKHQDRNRGWGNAILIQGAFLFVFDLAMVITFSTQNEELKQIFEIVGPTSNGLGLNIKF